MVNEMILTAWVALLWLVIGVGLSMLLVKVYDIIVFRKFDLQEAIEGGNSAVAIFFSLMLLGIGLVVAATIMSPGTGSLVHDIALTIGWSVGVSFIATLLFFAFDIILVPKIKLQETISNGNIAAGILSGVLYVAVSVVAMAVIMS
ncbi:hypothetical protein C5S31_02825 [ANME-1 cluster archaeon GoMg2]|nr:hypothetical protein [ANME-1 cluster archaeon GoMg2]